MSPPNLHSNEYLEHLRVFRDLALTESRHSGRRRNIGRFTYGIAQAQWQTKEGDGAYLTDQGLRYKKATFGVPMPTTLRIYSTPEDAGFERITFAMDLENIGRINIYRNLMVSGSFGDVIRAELSQRVDRKHGLSDPTDEERELLYIEMQRGASGCHPIDYSDEDEE